jgi:ureidoglycolate dehydrogenase (NAD+)
MGPVVTVFAMKKAIEKAKQSAIGTALIRNTTHQGAMGYYPLIAANKGMAGFASVSEPPLMAPYGARAAGIANSPIAIAVPAMKHRPLILDMATSVVAGGKIWLARDRGVPIPAGWALDPDGNPTTDANLGEVLLPMGGYKGSGLAIMMECLTSLMVGNPLVGPSLTQDAYRDIHIQNSVVAAIDIAAFTSLQQYRADVDSLIEGIKSLPKAEDIDEILVPGEPEDRVYDERVENGIPLPQGTIHNLEKVATRFGVPVPPPL